MFSMRMDLVFKLKGGRGNMAVNDLLKSMVPISRFNKGEAGNIFDVVNEEGIKLVLKNNSPACLFPKH